jgi:hypothetical protein
MTPGIQTIITAKKEYSELASDPQEKTPAPGQGYKHQRFYWRFLRSFSDLLIMDEAGVGKSCSVLGFVEEVLRERQKAQLTPLEADPLLAYFARVIILVPGESQRYDAINQLVCKCSNGHYVTPHVKNGGNANIRRRRLEQEIEKAGIFIYTTRAFAKLIDDTYTSGMDQELAEDYADTIFWLDEGHNINLKQGKTYVTKKLIYDTIWRIFHLALRSKRIITTATPFKHLDGFKYILNLLLPDNQALPLDYDYRRAPPNDLRVLFPGLPPEIKPMTASYEEMNAYFQGQIPADYPLIKATLEDLEPYLRGRIGYIRASGTGVKIINEVNEKIYERIKPEFRPQSKVYGSSMSDFQFRAYAKQLELQSGLNIGTRKAANLVLPDGSIIIGGEGKLPLERRQLTLEEEEFFPVPEEEISSYYSWGPDSLIPSEAFLREIRGKVQQYSCKFASIIKILKETEGNAFIFDDLVESGIMALGMCLEAEGFERYDGSEPMFETTANLEEEFSFCPTYSSILTEDFELLDYRTKIARMESVINQKSKGRKTKIKPKFRYAMITYLTNKEKIANILEAMNSYENRHGNYLKALLTSGVGKEGINVANVLQIHLVGSSWNENDNYQALRRGLRALSHDDLLLEKRLDLERKGQSSAELSVEVHIYRHAAIAPQGASVDLQQYLYAEGQDREIKRFLRYMKQCAVGCQIHYQRNVHPEDQDDTFECDYDLCPGSYPRPEETIGLERANRYCYDPYPQYVDYDTYDLFYVQELLQTIRGILVNLYRHQNAYSLEGLMDSAPISQLYQEKHVLMALSELIYQKTPLLNRFGFACRLRENRKIFFLESYYPSTGSPDYAMSYYSQVANGLLYNDLFSLKKITETPSEIIQLEDLRTLEIEELRARLEVLPYERQVIILEEALLGYLTEEEIDPYYLKVAEVYSIVTYEFPEPITELYNKSERKGMSNKGRKAKEGTVRRVEKINPNRTDQIKLVEDQDAEMVFIHTLNSLRADAKYSVISSWTKGERARLFKASENLGWRDLTDNEQKVYSILIQLENARRNQVFRDKGLYGIYLGREFRVVDVKREDTKAKTNGRYGVKGMNCFSEKRGYLIDVMWRLGLPPHGGIPETYDETNREEYIATIMKATNLSYEELQTWNIEKLYWYHDIYSLTTHDYNREDMCGDIKNKMEELDQLQK